MALKNIMRDFTLFVNGTLFSGDVEDVNTPKLTKKMEEYRGGGMDVPVEIALGMEKLELDFELSSHDPMIYSTFGLSQGTDHIFKIYAHLISHGGQETGVEITTNGQIKSIDPGSWKPGTKSTKKVMVNCTYYKHVVGGVSVFEIDAFQKKWIVNGVDLNASARGFLGL